MTTKTSKHTPGPWQKRGTEIIMQRNPGGFKTAIASCYRDCGTEQSIANARLISLAWMLPELVKALDRILEIDDNVVGVYADARALMKRYHDEEARK